MSNSPFADYTLRIQLDVLLSYTNLAEEIKRVLCRTLPDLTAPYGSARSRERPLFCKTR